MANELETSRAHRTLPRPALEQLFGALRARGYRLVGPRIRDGAIVFDAIEGECDLPIGWSDIQEPGKYRLIKRNDAAVFGYAVGPHSWKKFFHLPEQRLFRLRRSAGELVPEPPRAERIALIGARGCDLAAVTVQDRILMGGEHHDPHYVARRSDVFVVAVACGHAGNTCFCASMGTGPEPAGGYDVVLTELLAGEHRFVVEVASAIGADVVSELGLEPASAEDVGAAAAVIERTRANMGRELDTTNIRELFANTMQHPRWDDVAARCIACTNCTMVCPTCFCTTTEDVTDLTGETVERSRRWDSCYTLPFSYVHGGSVRQSILARYRQWLTHKLGTWIDQFESSGCVGCGRCITWCPVGIDLTEEVAALRTPAASSQADEEP
jgi:ferredoxin